MIRWARGRTRLPRRWIREAIARALGRVRELREGLQRINHASRNDAHMGEVSKTRRTKKLRSAYVSSRTY